MGIVAEDIDRVRAATDFVAVVSEHLALKRVGRQYQGLCPFHSEKSPSFSINPEKGVYYCYGCQASGDVISFVREVEKLDFAQAVERLAAKANITLRYDSEAAGRDRVRRAKLVESMDRAVDWYHDRLLKGADAGPARAYLRSRGYDGDAIRRFRVGWAPEGWDTLCRSLQLPTDVAKDTGLGFTNKVGKVNDFFQKRILFPIFDASGQPVAFGGRKLPDTEGPKYKNSSETKLYSKSRTLYGLNWAKANIVETGEVIVCEGYTDVIGFHLAGLPRAVATCGTALADEHFKMLKNYARRIVLSYDADSAGQNAAAKFFAWEKQYEIDLYVVALPPGADPADVARQDPEALHRAVADAKPFLAFRVERVMLAANFNTPEGRARAYEAAAAVVMEHPSPIVREQYLVQVAARCQVSEDTMAKTLSTPLASSKRSDTNGRGADRSQRGGGNFPSHGDGDGRGRVGTTGGSGQQRRVENSDPGASWVERDAPPDDLESYESFDAPRPYRNDRPGGSAPYRTRDNRNVPTGAGTNGRGSSTGRVSSPSLRAQAAAQRSRRSEEEALRWAVQDPEHMLGWLAPVLFADPVYARAVELLLVHGDVVSAADAVFGAEHSAADEVVRGGDRDDLDAAALTALRRLAVAPPSGDDDLEDALALVVANAAARVLATITSKGADAHPDEIGSLRTVKLLSESLREPAERVEALKQLVPWLTSWDLQRRQVTEDSVAQDLTNGN